MKHYPLIYKLTKREVVGRYQGSSIGLAWTIVTPLLMLAIYTVIFSEVFNMKWGAVGESKAVFAVMLFSGMVLLSFFVEVINRAPSLIISNANYVKKVIFPIEILPVVSVGSALFHMLTSLLILLAAVLFVYGKLSFTLLLIPIVLLPLMMMALGISWLLAGLGVYLRDIGQFVTVVSSMIMFLSPVFYPLSAVPESFKQVILLNPLTFIIEQFRLVVIYGQAPNWPGLAIYYLIAAVAMLFGYYCFKKIKSGFADVL